MFHRAIASSGVATCEWGLTDSHLERARELAAGLGIHEQDPDRMVQRLRELPAEALNKQHAKMNTMFVSADFDSIPRPIRRRLSTRPMCRCDADSMSTNPSILDVKSTAICP